MNINLEQDWIFFESIGATAYYGYNSLSNNSANNCAIRQVLGTGSTMTVNWNNNIYASYEANWNNRSYYFATPSNITVTATATGGPSIYTVTFNWISSTGSSRYYVNLYSNGSSIINLADGSGVHHNPYQNSTTKILQNVNSISINNCRAGYTYSATVYTGNGYGNSSTITSTISL